MKLTIICLFAALAPAFGQEAKIMILERQDTTRLKSAYQDFKKSQKVWEDLKLEVAKKYTVENGKSLEGWDKVDFSVDFRAVVPHREMGFNSGLRWSPITAVPAGSAFSGTTLMNTATGDVPLSITGADGTVATINAANGDLQVSVSPGVRPDLKTKER